MPSLGLQRSMLCMNEILMLGISVDLCFGVQQWLSFLGSHLNHLKCLLKLQITGPHGSFDPLYARLQRVGAPASGVFKKH